MDIQQEIAENLKDIVNRMGVLVDTVKVEIPAQSSFGDMTSNIAMQISKQLNANPVDIAKEIVKDFPKNGNSKQNTSYCRKNALFYK